jgi:hypothetical protein
MELSKLIILPTFLLTIASCGGGGESSSPAPIPSNITPTANAGADSTVNENTTVSLTGSGSDSDGSISNYSWEQISGTAVTIDNPSSKLSSFIAPDISSNEVLTFELTVTDNDGAIGKDIIDITIVNLDPDFPLTDFNKTLVRYTPNSFIKYEVTGLAKQGDETLDLASERTESYSYSSDPLTFGDDSVESITRTISSVLYNTNATSLVTYDAIQFPDEFDYSSTLFLYYKYDDGYKYSLNYTEDSRFPIVSLMSNPSVGYYNTSTVTEHRYNTREYGSDAENYTIFRERSITSIEVVDTPLGKFEAYKMESLKITTSASGEEEDTIVTESWIHPAIGIIKYQTIARDNTNVTAEFTGIISTTNLSY